MAEKFKWGAIEPPAVNGLQDAGTAIAGFLQLVKAELELAKLSIQAAALLTLGVQDAKVLAANAAIGALISAVNEGLTQLLGSTGLYLLPVPPPKKGLYRFVAQAVDEGEEASNTIEFPANSVLSRGTPEQQEALRNSALWTQLLNPTDLFSGGNAYFLKALSESLFDARDTNRPRFPASSYWAYGLLLAGSSDLTSLVELLGFMQRLFGGRTNANQVGVSQGLGSIVPQGVTVTPSSLGTDAIVSWDLVPVNQVLSSYDQATVEAVEYAVIRSTGLEARTVGHVYDLFASNELKAGMEGSYGSKILAVKSYDGIVTRYIDTSTLEDGVTYYYHLAFSTQIRPPGPDALEILKRTFSGANTPTSRRIDSEPKVLGFDLLSSAARYRKPARREDHCVSSLGKAPDWIRTPTAGMVPAINGFVDDLQEYLRKLQNTVSNVSNQNSAIVALLNKEIAKYEALSNSITQRIQQITTVFTAPSAGIYGTFRYGSGGTSSFLTDVVRAFEDSTDTNRPPFTNGDEFVSGVAIVAVSPSEASVLAAWNLLRLLFAPTDATDPALVGIRSINTQLAQVEADLVSQITGGTNNPLNPSVTFNEDMTPRGAGEGDSTCDP